MKVLVFPKDSNPYQRLLYGAMADQHSVTIKYIHRFPYIGSVHFVPSVALYRLAGYRLIHVHWPAFAVGPKTAVGRKLSLVHALMSLKVLQVLRVRLIWTVHDAVPHEPETADDLRVSRTLARDAVRKIAHSEATIRQLRSLGLDSRRCEIIGHGSYIGVYPSGGSKHQARVALDVDPASFVFVFVGLIRPYKGVPDLIRAFHGIVGDDLRLVIAGKCFDTEVMDELSRTMDRRISFTNEYVEDGRVWQYFRAADVACLPFTSVTTSGSALLAMSFGCPIITSNQGDMADLPPEVGYVYNGAGQDALREAMLHALRHRGDLAAKGETAFRYAQTLTWDRIAGATYSLYESVDDETTTALPPPQARGAG